MLFFAETAVAVVAPQAAPSPSPAPAATQLREIGHARSSAYCTMLAKRIAPALYALVKTDELIAAGNTTLGKMGNDSLMGSHNHYDLDLSHLSQVITIATRNLQAVKKLLGDPAYFPANPQSEEDRSAADLKAKLERVAAQQNGALDLMNGTHETARMAEMQEGFSPLQPAPSARKMGGTPAPTASPSSWTPDPSQYLNAAGLPDRDVNSQFSQKALAAGSSSGRTSYDSVGQVLQLQQTRIAAFEKAASDAVAGAVDLCNAPHSPEQQAQPSPAPSGSQ